MHLKKPVWVRVLAHGAAKWLVLSLAALPLLMLIQGAVQDRLGANPAEYISRSTGDWALRMLWLTLSLTPLRLLTGQAVFLRFRRGLGLWSFAYASLHFLAYAWLDMGFEWGDVRHDIGKRPFILVGVLTWLVLLPLALTSNQRAIRRLGGLAWKRLHRLVYPAAVLAMLHFYWMRASKSAVTEVGVYALLLLGLFAIRAWWRFRPAPIPVESGRPVPRGDG